MHNIQQAALILIFFLFPLWTISVAKKDASIVDRVWGLMFILLGFCYSIQSSHQSWRSLVVLALVSIWGLRLSLHIHLRNHGHGEDPRYQAMREKTGKKFWWTSFFSVFLLQGGLALLISMPLYVSIALSPGAGLLGTDILGALLWIVGMIFEAGGDWQLKQFKNDPANRGKILNTGLWSLTRHPNYFGDACIWWGYFFFTLSHPLGAYTIISPIVMTLLLRYVSGVSLLEKSLKPAKPGYEEYVQSTPAFIPHFPWKLKK